MGVLDELKQQVDLKNATQHTEERYELIRQQNYENIVLPKLQQLYFYLKELIDHLKAADYKTEIKDYSKRYPHFDTLSQQDYRISTDGLGGIVHINELKMIDIAYFLRGSGEFVYYVKYRSNIEKEEDFLRSCRVPYHLLTRTHAGNTQVGTFKVTKQVPVLFNISTNEDNTKIIIKTYNHQDLVYLQKTYEPERIDKGFMEKLARYILRKDHDFFKLEISETQKSFIVDHTYGSQQRSDEIEGLISSNHIGVVI